MQCGHTVLAGFIFMCHQRSRGALSCAAQAASQPSRAKIRKLLYHRFQSGGFLLVMYNRRDRRVSPAATPGAPFIPVGKDAMTPWIFFSSQPLFYHKSHYVTRFCGRFVVQTPPKRVRKIRFFLYCIQDSPIFLSTCKKAGSTP